MKMQVMNKIVLWVLASASAMFAGQAYAVDCTGLSEWNATAAYNGATQVKELGKAYKANWWSQGHSPASYSGQYQEWTLLGVCDGAMSSAATTSSKASSSSVMSSLASSAKTSSSSSTAGSVSGGSCASPQYVAGTSYVVGQLVQNVGSEYRCTIAGWCSSPSAWAYAPGSGSAWTQAWDLVRSCSAASASSSSATSSSVASSAKSSVSSVASSVASTTSSSVSSVSTGLPKHSLVGYWHNFDNGSGLLRVASVDSTWDVIVIAFADDAGNGAVKFTLDPALNKAQFIADVAAKRAQGKKVVLSFGGQNGTVTLNNATNVANFVSSTSAILNEYGFDGIDIDLESGAGVSWGAPVITNLVTAVKQLKASFPNLYLSMAPEHPYVQGGFVAASGIWGAYLPLIDGLRNELTILHVQLYNNGGLSTPYSNQPLQAGTVDMMVGSVLMLVEGFPVANNTTFAGLRPDQVALGLPSGPQAANSGQATTVDIAHALNCLTKLTECGSVKPKAAYPTFRGVMTWSINWDVRDGRPFSVPVSASLKALP
jgi:chitinase